MRQDDKHAEDYIVLSSIPTLHSCIDNSCLNHKIKNIYIYNFFYACLSCIKYLLSELSCVIYIL